MRAEVAWVPVLLAAAALVACGDSPVEKKGDPRVTLSADSVTVVVGASSLVSVTVLNASESARLVSRDPGVATVDANGAIRGVAAGSTYVVATLPSQAEVRDSVRVRGIAPRWAAQ